MSLKFKNPPINELVIGTYFNPPLFNLRAEHIGLFWSQIRKEYPQISRQIPIGAIIEDPDDVFPLPRFWIISEDDVLLMQIQKNAFLFNWRKRDQDYPHFDVVKAEYDRFYLKFAEFLKSEAETPDIKIDVCELTYINLISANEYWQNINDTANVIPSFQFIDPGIDGSTPTEFNHISIHQLDEELRLKITIKNVHPAEQPDKSHLIFEIRASGRLGKASKSDADQWFERAHIAIGDCFKGMTNPDIQNEYWQPVEQT